MVTEESTAFYEFGPSQASGPDRRLHRGQVIKLSQSNRGWAKVELEDGSQGYIGTDQMRQAAKTDFADPLLAPATQFAAAGGRVPQPWVPAAPMPDLPDLPMTPGSENSLLLLPPLEFDGDQLKKSSLRTTTPQEGDLKPGDLVKPDILPSPGNDPALPALPGSAPLPSAAGENLPPLPAPSEGEAPAPAPTPAPDPSTPATPTPADPAPAAPEPAAPAAPADNASAAEKPN